MSSTDARMSTMVDISSATSKTAYRAGLCIDCRAVPYSAGRPRCTACHDAYAREQRRQL